MSKFLGIIGLSTFEGKLHQITHTIEDHVQIFEERKLTINIHK